MLCQHRASKAHQEHACGSLVMGGGRTPPTTVREGLCGPHGVSSTMIFTGTGSTKAFPLKETQTPASEAVREHMQDSELNQITEGQPRGRAAESCVEAAGWE